MRVEGRVELLGLGIDDVFAAVLLLVGAWVSTQRESSLLIPNWSESISSSRYKWTGLAPWEFEFSPPGSLQSTFLGRYKTRRAPLYIILEGSR